MEESELPFQKENNNPHLLLLSLVIRTISHDGKIHIVLSWLNLSCFQLSYIAGEFHTLGYNNSKKGGERHSADYGLLE